MDDKSFSTARGGATSETSSSASGNGNSTVNADNQVRGRSKAKTKKQSAEAADPTGKVVIKKYANRRLYNTATSAYVTLETLCKMVKDGVDFDVVDAKTNENITRSVLTQIIVEEEAKGENLLPTDFLRKIIALYGDGVDGAVHSYLDQSMQLFMRNQEAVRNAMLASVAGSVPGSFPGAVGGEQASANNPPANPFEAMAKQNMALFENAMNLFNPMAAAEATAPNVAEASAPTATPTAEEPTTVEPAADGTAEMASNETAATNSASAKDDLSALKAQMDAIQSQLNKLSGD